MQRRAFLSRVIGAGVTLPLMPNAGVLFSQQTPQNSVASSTIPGTKNVTVPIRPITRPPGSHFYGYYDRPQFDPTSRYALGSRVDFNDRTPLPEDRIAVGMVDLGDGDRWIPLGESAVLSWQMSCLSQWIPQSSTDVIWNDREGDRFVSRILNTKTRQLRTLPKPIFALSPDGSFAIGTDFARIDGLRPGCGYAGVVDQYFHEKTPSESGVYRIDLKTGETRTIVSLAELGSIPHRGEDVSDNFHWVNHISINPSGTRFSFLNRWRKERTTRQQMAGGGFKTRMFTYSTDGSDPYILDDSGTTSHYVWRDNHFINIFTAPGKSPRAFYIIEDKTDRFVPIGKNKMKLNGHLTYLPHRNNEWMVSDSYPSRTDRMQQLFLYNDVSNTRIDLGLFHEPEQFTGEWRCDLHPRCSPDGKKIVIDSTLSGERQMWLADINELVL